MSSHENDSAGSQIDSSNSFSPDAQKKSGSNLVAPAQESPASSEKVKPTLELRFLPGYKISVNGREFKLKGGVERRAILKVEILKMLLARRLPDGGSEPITKDNIRTELESQQIDFLNSDIENIDTLRPSIKIGKNIMVERLWEEKKPTIRLNPAFRYIVVDEEEQVLSDPEDASQTSPKETKPSPIKHALYKSTYNPPIDLYGLRYAPSKSDIEYEDDYPVPSISTNDAPSDLDLPDISTAKPPQQDRYDEEFVRHDAWDDVVPEDEESDNDIELRNLYEKLIKQYKVLNRKEERDLFLRLESGDKSAREEIIRHNLRLVPYVIRSFLDIKDMDDEMAIGSKSAMDFVQVGNIELVRIVDIFDIHKGFKFSTYAVPRIRQAVGRAKDKPQETLTDVFGQEPLEAFPTPADPEEFKRDPDNIPTNELDRQAQELLLDRGQEDLFEALTKAIAHKPAVSAMLEVLTEKERRIIELRFGLSGQSPLKLDDVGEEFGLTRERIRQIEAKTIKKLRRLTELKELEDLL